ncbi:MAG: DUF167 domain-containing protein [Nitrospinota bacterium]
MSGPVQSCEEGSLLDCRVVPSSSRNCIAEVTDDNVRIKITSPPLEGKANKTLTAFLGKMFKISKNRVKIVSGESARKKRVLLAGLTREEALKTLREKE